MIEKMTSPDTQYTAEQWAKRLPTNYGMHVYPDGTLNFDCPMGTFDQYDAETIAALGNNVKTMIYPGNNEDPCGWWLNIVIPANLVRQPTPLETALAKLEKCNFTKEERAALLQK